MLILLLHPHLLYPGRPVSVMISSGSADMIIMFYPLLSPLVPAVNITLQTWHDWGWAGYFLAILCSLHLTSSRPGLVIRLHLVIIMRKWTIVSHNPGHVIKWEVSTFKLSRDSESSVIAQPCYQFWFIQKYKYSYQTCNLFWHVQYGAMHVL